MELLEGQTLLERLEKGSLPTDQVLRFGIEIADALSQAHKHGVVHRDLKPGNIMLTKSGVKLLDFGLAKTHATGGLGVGSEMETGTRPLTQAGTLLGTYQYMAPEQLEGKEADARTDIWGLGCVLYEMATGQRAFSGKSQASLIDAFSAPTYAALGGNVLFVRDGALRAQAFDAAATRLTGDPVTLAEPVQVDQNLWGGTPVSVGGDVLAHRSGRIGTVQLTWLDRDGRELGSLGPSGDYGEGALSPDGGTLVIAEAGAMHLTLVDLGTSAFRPFTFKPERATTPSWSPDGRSIAYASNRNGAFGIFRVPATGVGTEENLAGPGDARNPVFSPDGRLLLYESSAAKTQYDLWVVPLSGDRKRRPFLRTEASETHASFSPNGRWVAYTSDTSGRAEVYVRAFPSGEGPWQISTEGGDQPQWRRDGRELFYLSPARRMMAVAVNGDGSAFKASPPKALFRARMRAPSILAMRNEYVVRADGRRFLINKLVEDPAKATISVVVNWASKLPR